jgi:predicted HicB family RNase H-like nuclease
MMIRVAPDLKKDVMALAAQRGTDLTKLVQQALDGCLQPSAGRFGLGFE